MASELQPVSIEVAMPTVALPDDQVPLEVLARRLKTRKELDYWGVEQDCRKFAETMQLWRDKGLYKHFSPTWEEFVTEHVRKPQEWIDHVIKGVEILDKFRD